LIAYRRRATIAWVSLLLVGCASGRGRVPGEPIPDQMAAEVPGPVPEPGEGPTQLEMRNPGEPEQEIARGLASWYGKKFHGRRTASGERFDMNDLTAAHPSLPFGTRLRVRNPANGREVAVRVNDRGPHTGRRIIDLSRSAAHAIGLLEAGVGTVVLLRP
jgi:rare lipoprotein A